MVLKKNQNTEFFLKYAAYIKGQKHADSQKIIMRQHFKAYSSASFLPKTVNFV